MTTEFSRIQFDKRGHVYTLDGARLPSVTTLVGGLKPSFDARYWAEQKAEERGVAVETVLAEWENKRQASMARGTRVHEYIEKVLKTSEAPDPFLELNTKLPEMIAFDALWKKLQCAMQVEFFRAEWIVGDAELRVAGTVDAALFSDMTGRLHVFDWKTGEKFRGSNHFACLLPPFDDLDDCELSVYSLQTSLYRLIIERNTDLLVGDSYIAHMNVLGEHQLYVALDLRERAEAWLRDRK